MRSVASPFDSEGEALFGLGRSVASPFDPEGEAPFGLGRSDASAQRPPLAQRLALICHPETETFTPLSCRRNSRRISYCMNNLAVPTRDPSQTGYPNPNPKGASIASQGGLALRRRWGFPFGVERTVPTHYSSFDRGDFPAGVVPRRFATGFGSEHFWFASRREGLQGIYNNSYFSISGRYDARRAAATIEARWWKTLCAASRFSGLPCQTPKAGSARARR